MNRIPVRFWCCKFYFHLNSTRKLYPYICTELGRIFLLLLLLLLQAFPHPNSYHTDTPNIHTRMHKPKNSAPPVPLLIRGGDEEERLTESALPLFRSSIYGQLIDRIRELGSGEMGGRRKTK